MAISGIAKSAWTPTQYPNLTWDEDVDAQRARYGVEPICKVSQFAPATYYAATKSLRQ